MIRGENEAESIITFKNTNAWSLLGDNTVEHLTIDVSRPNKSGDMIKFADNSHNITIRGISS